MNFGQNELKIPGVPWLYVALDHYSQDIHKNLSKKSDVIG